MANRQPYKFPRPAPDSAGPFGNLRPAAPLRAIDPALAGLANPGAGLRPTRPRPAPARPGKK